MCGRSATGHRYLLCNCKTTTTAKSLTEGCCETLLGSTEVGGAVVRGLYVVTCSLAKGGVVGLRGNVNVMFLCLAVVEALLIPSRWRAVSADVCEWFETRYAGRGL